MLSMYKYYTLAEKKFSYLSESNHTIVLGYLHQIICRQLSHNYLQKSTLGIDRFLKHVQGSSILEVTKIERKDIRSFVEFLLASNLKPVTINGYLNSLKMLFDYAVDEEYMRKNPVPIHYFLKTEKCLPRPMDPVDLQSCLAHLPVGKYQVLFMLMLHCGLRVSEACHLKWHDINWEQNRLLVHNGKGKVDRMVYFPKGIETLLQNGFSSRKEPGDYCFPSIRSLSKPLNPTYVQAWMKEFTRLLGLSEKNYTPHVLRHTFATKMLNAGVPLYVLKELMGHKTLDQTLLYAQLSDQFIRTSYLKAFENDSPHLNSDPRRLHA